MTTNIENKLNERINIYKALDTSFINRDNYEFVTNRIKCLTGKDIPLLDITDLYNMDKKEFINIINKSIYEDSKNKRIIVYFDHFAKIIKYSNDINELSKANNYFNNILDELNKFYRDYHNKNDEKQEYNDEQLKKLEQCKNILLTDKMENYTSVNELDSLKGDLTKFGFDEDERIDALIKLNSNNIKLSYERNENINLKSKVNSLNNKYLNNDNIVNLIKEMFNDSFDFTMLDSISRRMSKETSYDYNTLYNTTIALLINSYYKEYINSNKEEYINKINKLFELLKNDSKVTEKNTDDENIIKLNNIKEYLLRTYDDVSDTNIKNELLHLSSEIENSRGNRAI